MQDLNVALIQTELVWEDPQANLERLAERIGQVANDVDLIVLPEMFTTGFSMNPARLAQTMDGPAVAWMHEQSLQTGADLVGSLIITDNGHYYNRLLWIKPDGRWYAYDKKHLFRYAGEDRVYSAGQHHLLVDCRGWRIRPFVCYDLRFPIWNRNIDNTYDAAVYVANWPEPRATHWKALLLARAIENQCYVAAVNRVGQDGNGHHYSGDSGIIDPQGRMIAGASQVEAIITDRFSVSVLQHYRESFPAWKDADGDLLEG